MVYIDELAREQTITVPVSRRNDQRRMNWTLRTAYGRGGAASFYSKQTTPNPELTIFAQALALILYASSGEISLLYFYFGIGQAVKKRWGAAARQ